MPTAAQYRSLSAYHGVASRGGVAAADPYRLAPTLMSGALERIDEARARMERQEFAQKGRLLRAAVSIIEELRGGLDLRNALEVNQDDLYDYLGRQLRHANRQNDPAILDEVSHLLREMRAAWILLPPPPHLQRVPAAAVK